MEKDILRSIIPGLMAFKYSMFFWAAFIAADATGLGLGLEILAKILTYWQWLFVATLTLVITATFAGVVPKKTQAQKERERETIREIFKDIPVFRTIEGDVRIARLVSFGTLGMVLYTLHTLAMLELFTSLLIPTAIAMVLSIVFKYIE